jgi:hypothetical protein
MKQEKAESDKAKEIEQDLPKAKILAAQLAELVYAQDETMRQKIIASGILFSSLAAMHGIPLTHAIHLLVSCYELADNFFESAGPMQ